VREYGSPVKEIPGRALPLQAWLSRGDEGTEVPRRLDLLSPEQILRDPQENRTIILSAIYAYGLRDRAERGLTGMSGMKEFEGKLAFITGGSSGIGLSTAELLAAEGARLLLFARGRERLEEAVRRVEGRRKDKGQRISFRQLDVTDHREVRRVMEEAVEEFGVPDLLINCAGRARPDYFENITWEQFDETMKVHIYGIWNTVSALVPRMKEKGGWIVNTTSLLGFLGVFGYTDYCASKYAIVGFSEALRSELKPHGLGVSVLCPPDTDTPGFAVENLTKPPETVAVSEGGGLMQPEDVAAALLKGIRKGRFFILPGNARTVFYLKRYTPWLVDRVMDRQIRRVRAGRQSG